MYHKHELFESPENEDTRIWRYFDTNKFFDLLKSQALFFSRADRLKDQFEGSIPKPTLDMRRKNFDPISCDIRSQYTKEFRKVVLVNCWHMNDFESDAMWKIYLKDGNGVAIQSTFKKLVQCFPEDPNIIVNIGKMKYIDFELESFQDGNLFEPYLYKRKEFEHEKELRAIILYPNADVNKNDFLTRNFDFNGMNIPINPKTLIEKVYIHPNCKKRYAKKISSILKKFDVPISPTPSRLSKNPTY